MKVQLAYGQGHLPVEFPDGRTTVIEPSFRPGLADERAAVLDALNQPIGSPPLAEWLKPGATICILFTDITRATPNDRLIPWLLAYLETYGVRREQITLLNQLGTHRPNTPAELERMLTPAVVANYRVLNHEPENHAACVAVGSTRTGTPAWLNRHAVEADVRILTGFIEPHFFAGFSGGPKALMPGVAHVETVMSNHGAHNIGDPRATFGVCEGNPLWEELRDIALRVGPSFLLNVTLNERRAITGVFAGDLLAAHRAGREFVRTAAMQKVKSPFEVVVTTNSGYPLDLNLYQGVKGMSAAARIVAEHGTIILAAECSEGVPADSPLDRLLREARSPEEILTFLATPGFIRPEQWQAQIQALIQRRAKVLVHSSISAETLAAAHLQPCTDIAASVQAELKRFGPDSRVAVLPQGPLTIPYLA
ncbi:MAG TPA: nickel-dependent lactate racemase [Verrucomicrobiota bacterium]|nr:nickel-dependent lactate racemase [Verrucomicrobiales bacterium]HRI13701.1 nickel-dependent lactate racemase [Verrucomicrobiota bacterium]